MKYHKYLLLFIIMSCISKKQEKTVREISDDSVMSVRLENKMQDSFQEREQEFLTEEEDSIFQNLKAMYQRKNSEIINIDTLILTSEDSFKISFMHFSSKEDSISISSTYYRTKKPFVTSAQISLLKIYKNGVIILEKRIEKELFSSNLNEELNNYGVLMFPYLEEKHLKKNLISIHYSISIPLTDIGVGVKLISDFEGNIEITMN